MVVAMTGCFRWAPVTSLYEVRDDRVRLTEGESVVVLDHATANGRVVLGKTALQEVVEVDVSHARVEVRRINGLATAGIITGASVLTTATALFAIAILAIASAPRPVLNGAP